MSGREGSHHGPEAAPSGTVAVAVFGGPTFAIVGARVTAYLASALARPPVLLPSSLMADDPLAAAIGGAFAARGASSRLLVPDRPLRAVRSMVPWGDAVWAPTTIAPPDGPPRRILLPRGIVGGDPLIAVTDVAAVAGRGPFVLDLVARYAHPLSRIRQVVDRDRAGRAAEVNLTARPDWSVLGVTGPPAIVAVTNDLVAGELVALSLAEGLAGHGGEFASPWEDRVVQRATELELGARIPDDITLEVVATDNDTVEIMRETVENLRRRIGIAMAAPMAVRIEPG